MSTQANQAETNQHWKDCMVAVASSQDKQAFQALYLQFAPKIKSFYLQQGLGAKAEELAHEVFLKVWQKAASYDPVKAQVSTWIFTIVRNLRIDFLRKRRINEVQEEDYNEPQEEAKLAETLDADRSHEALKAHFNLLNEEQRNVLQKVYFEDKSHQIAARELEMTPGEVKSRIRSSLKILRDTMGDSRS